MADTKITSLQPPQVGYPVVPATDVLPIVVIADPGMATSGSTRKVTVNQLLGAGGTATLASATITGNLTVDTSTLFVNSSTDRVGIGTTIPSNGLQVQGAGQATVTPVVTGDQSALLLVDSGTAGNNGGMLVLGASVASGFLGQVAIKSLLSDGTQNGTASLAFFTRGATSDSTLTERYRIAANGVATWSNVGGTSGTAMTLNATGLGIGTTILGGQKLAIGSSSDTSATTNGFNIVTSRATIQTTCNGATDAAGTTINYSWANGGQGPLIFRNAAISNVLTLDAAGNCGIGVTPSYLLHTAVASGANRNIARFQVTGASNGLTIAWNHATTKMIVNFSNLPTSSAGLASGDLWIDTSAGNTLKVA